MSSSKQGNQRDRRRRSRDAGDPAGGTPAGDGAKPASGPRPRITAKGPNPLAAGIRSTSASAMRGIRRVSPPVARAISSVARLLIAAILWIAAKIERVLGPAHRALGPITAAGLAPIGRAVTALEKVITPRRALAVTGIFAAACLIGSQFLDASGVAIGGDQYGSVSALTSPPLKGVETPFGPHGPAVLLLGIASLALLVLALLRSDRRFALCASLAGLLSVVISLGIDVPASADIGVLATQFEGTDSVLLTGFYTQLAAASILTLTGALLAIRTPMPIRERRTRSESPAAKAGAPPATPGTVQAKQVGT